MRRRYKRRAEGISRDLSGSTTIREPSLLTSSDGEAPNS
jgi:hypothetical protein